MSNSHLLTPDRLDMLLERPPRERIIWTAESIARRIGTSADFVRDKLAKEPGSPVKMIGGRYCAHEADLLAFFRADRKKW